MRWNDKGIVNHAGRVAGLALAFAGLSTMLLANIQEIRPRPNNNWGRDRGQGEMNIRLRVDDEVEVAVRGDRMFIRTLSGKWAQEKGSDLSAPLPLRKTPFELSKRSGRGRVWLVEEPNDGNRYTARFRISDPQRGDSRYHVRLRYGTESWGWESGAAVEPKTGVRGSMRPSPVPVVAASWREPAWGRPSSWNRLPGRT
ncbi:MAG: hypothetical protein KIT83_21660, partial [Bryobacterales bacterium]|nr:hypothetical protein [Bryobacterales bacterium]